MVYSTRSKAAAQQVSGLQQRHVAGSDSSAAHHAASSQQAEALSTGSSGLSPTASAGASSGAEATRSGRSEGATTGATAAAAAAVGGVGGGGKGSSTAGVRKGGTSTKSSSLLAAHPSSLTPRRTLLLGSVSTVLWMLFSSLLIILNKRVYQMGFPHPCFVTGMGQVFSALGGYALVAAGAAPLRPVPPLRFALTRIAPIVASTAATMFFGNAAYLTLSVAFIQILKAFTPALTLLLCVLAGLERPRWPLLLSVLLIAGGTAGAVLIESGTPSFHMGGFLHFLMSSITEAARVVGAEVLLGAARYNSAEALVYIGGPTAVVLMVASAILEGPALAAGTAQLLASHPVPFLAAFTMSFLVNLSCFFAIKYTSSLTFKVAGCVKNVAVVGYGVVAHGEHVSLLQMIGYALSVVGFAMYSKLKIMASSPHRGKGSSSSAPKGGSKQQAVAPRQRGARGGSSSPSKKAGARSRWGELVDALLRLGQPPEQRGRAKTQ